MSLGVTTVFDLSVLWREICVVRATFPYEFINPAPIALIINYYYLPAQTPARRRKLSAIWRDAVEWKR
jgi:hypothetical protein